MCPQPQCGHASVRTGPFPSTLSIRAHSDVVREALSSPDLANHAINQAACGSASTDVLPVNDNPPVLDLAGLPNGSAFSHAPS